MSDSRIRRQHAIPRTAVQWELKQGAISTSAMLAMGLVRSSRVSLGLNYLIGNEWLTVRSPFSAMKQRRHSVLSCRHSWLTNTWSVRSMTVLQLGDVKLQLRDHLTLFFSLNLLKYGLKYASFSGLQCDCQQSPNYICGFHCTPDGLTWVPSASLFLSINPNNSSLCVYVHWAHHMGYIN